MIFYYLAIILSFKDKIRSLSVAVIQIIVLHHATGIVFANAKIFHVFSMAFKLFKL